MSAREKGGQSRLCGSAKEKVKRTKQMEPSYMNRAIRLAKEAQHGDSGMVVKIAVG